MPKSAKILLLAVSVVLVLSVFLSVNGVRAAQQDGAYPQIGIYQKVLQHIQQDYVTPPNISQVTNGALHGLLESLDADSSYLSAADYKSFKDDKGGKAQVGVTVSKRGGYATVVSVVPNSPADKANITDGEFIEAVDGHDTHDLSLATIRMMLQGQPGSSLTLSIVRPPKPAPEKVALTRAMVLEPPVAETVYENSTILYLRPMILDHDHVSQVEAKLKGMGKAGNKKVLLDLRDVSAGDVTEATHLANMLLKTGTIATLEGQTVPKQTITADPSKAINPTAPIVVLINRGTSGPAEIVASALGDNKRADLVGDKTFGDGSMQKTFELQDGAALILTVAKYHSPSGKKIADEGVTPNVIVAPSEDAEFDEDEATAAAAASPTPATSTAITTQLPKKPAVSVDEQLNKALELLKSKPA